MSFPGAVLSFWYDVISGARMIRGQAGIDAFRTYLNGGGNTTIRFYVANTTGWGHQTSSALLIKRLCSPVQANIPGYDYAGSVEVYIDVNGGEPYETTRTKMIALLGFVANGDGPYPLNNATVRFYQYNPQNPPKPTVNLGFTGGADPNDHFAANLNTNYFLRMQPYRWKLMGGKVPEEVQYLSMRWPYVNLDNQFVLGYHMFEERAYVQPVDVPAWGGLGANQQAMILQWLTDDAQLSRFDFCPIYSIRTPATCELGLAGQALIQTLGGVLAAGLKAHGRPAVVVNLDVYEPAVNNPDKSYDAIRDALETGTWLFSGSELTAAARRLSFEALNARDRYDVFVFDPGSATNLATLQTKITQWLLVGNSNKVLYIQLARSTARITPDLFAYAYTKSTLPGVFEGQNTANLALNIGLPYFHVNRPQSVGTEQYPGDLLSQSGGSKVARSLQTIADQIVWNLGQWPLNPPNPMTKIADFVEAYRTEGAHGVYHEYFQGMQQFYRDSLNDKFNLSITFLNYLINGKKTASAPLALTALAATAEDSSGDTLDSIYTAFSNAAQSGQPVNFRDQLDADGQIASFIKSVEDQFGGVPFVINGTKVSRTSSSGGDIESVTVTGTCVLFGADVPVSVSAVFTAPDGTVSLTCRYTGDIAWRPDGLQWIGFGNPYIEFICADADLPVAGKVGGTLLGPDINCYAVLPPNNGKMLFVGDFNSPPSIDKLFQLAGSVNLVSTLPSPLNIITQMELEQVQFGVDGTSIEFFTFLLNWQDTSGKGWQFLPNIFMQQIQTLITVGQPADATSLKAVVTGVFAIGTGDNAGVVQVGVTVPDLSFNAQLTSGEILLADLLAMFLPGVTLNPPSLPSITEFSMTGAQKTGDYSLNCQLGFNWNIPSDSLAILNLENIGIIVNRSSGATTGELSGTVTLLPDDAENALTLDLRAAYLGAEDGWEFSGAQASDTQSLSLLRLIAKYLLQGWQAPGDYAINGLHFTTRPSAGSYTIGGKTAAPWTLPFIAPEDSPSIAAALEMSYDPKQTANSGYSGTLKATVTWKSISLDIGCEFGEKYVYTLDWGVFHASIAQNDEDQWVATGSLKGQTLGSIVEEFISYATGQRFGLPSPWDSLNSVSLDGLEVSFNFTTKAVGFSINIGTIDLGFCKITGIGVTYDSSAPSADDRKVMIEIKGSFVWQSGDTLSWDATDPDKAPGPPGGGNELLDLRLLAFGQQVGIVGYQQFTSVQQAINQLYNLDKNGAPISGPNPNVVFDPNVSWLFAIDFGLMKVKQQSGSEALATADDAPQYTVTLSIVFADPNLYALRIAMAGPAAKVLAGLAFEILYRKISDSIGVYQAELTLPTAMRQIDVGAFSITFPVIAVAVYTNGDFTIDIGFPWNQDFSRSFTIQGIVAPGIPVMGSAGFYFGKLSSATSTQVRKASNGQFDPIIIFGIGVQIGIGKSVDYGILKAGFSLTVFGILQGVIAKWCPNDAVQRSSSQIQDNYYFWLQGTFGIIGKLYGSVDFAIIKASVDVELKLMAQITYESFSDIPISVIASVSVTASVKIDLWLFSITIHFSFSLNIKETFTIKNSGTAPWIFTDAQPTLAARHALTLRAARPMAVALVETSPEFTWTNLVAAQTPQSLTGYLAPAITISGDTATSPNQQTACYVLLLALESSDPSVSRTADTVDTSFDLLAKQIFRWVVAANMTAGNYTAGQIDVTAVSDDALQNILSMLNNEAVPMPIPADAIDAFMKGQFVITVSVPTASGSANAAPFPVSPKLSLEVSDANPAISYSFGTFNSANDTYLEMLRTYFSDLEVQAEKETDDDDATQPMAAVADSNAVSVATFVFCDYFRLIARQMLESARDALRDYKYALTQDTAVGSIIEWISANNGSMYTTNDVFQANTDHPLTVSQSVTIRSAQAQAPQGATFTTIAGTQYNHLFTAADLASANHDSPTLLRSGATITYPDKGDYTVQLRDSLDAVAAHYGVDLATMLQQVPDILTQSGLIIPLAVLTLPDFKYTTVEGDTPKSVTERFGMSMTGLGISENDGVKFSASTDTLDIPHLTQLNTGALLDDIARTNGLSRISGMTGRYALHGLRLPTSGLTPAPQAELSGVYALTGQQFNIPTLPETGTFSYALQLPSDASWWISFGGENILTVTVKSDDPNDTTWSKIMRLQAFLAGSDYRFAPPGTTVGSQQLYRDQALTWTATDMVQWQTPGTITLPYGQAPAGVQALRLWGLSENLYNLYDSNRSAPPRVLPMLGTYNEASGTIQETQIGYYGWATKVGLTVKRVASDAGSTSGATTYELIGSGEADIVLLERLLSALNGQSGPINSLTLLYAPDSTGSAPSGAQSDDPASVTLGIMQANLSTETHPPTSMAMFATLATVQQAPELNSAYDFIKLLWECSITRSGGYYLYYFNGSSGSGFPDRIFNDNGEASLTLLIMLTPPAAELQNQITAYTNCLVTGDAFSVSSGSDSSSASTVYAKSNPPSGITHTPAANETLSGIAYCYYMDPVALATDNPSASCASGATVKISRGCYEVGTLDPAGDPQAIANWFGISLDRLKSANPQITDWGAALALYTVLRLPSDLTITVGTSKGGTTLASLATYYGTDVAGIVADNLDTAGLLATSNTLVITGGPNVRSATVPSGCVGITATRAVPQQPGIPDVDNPDFARRYIEEQFVLLGYRVTDNAWFEHSNIGLPISHANPSDDAATPDRTSAPPMSDNTPWQYDRTVPVSGFGKPLTVDPGSPYRAVGDIAQLDLGWMDVFGNTVIGSLGDAATTLNRPPQPVEYTDALLGISSWPSVNVDYQVAAKTSQSVSKSKSKSKAKIQSENVQPSLSLNLNFDPTPYSTGEAAAWKAMAAQVLPVYDLLQYQLTQTIAGSPAVSISVNTDLLRNGTMELTTERTTLTDWLFGAQGVREYIYQRSLGNTPSFVPSDCTLDWSFTLDDINDSELFELTCSIELARPAALVDANFLATPGIAVSETRVPARQTLVNGTMSLAQFATDLEACLQQAGGYAYKLMTGIDRSQVQSSSQSKPLWILCVSLGGSKGIRYTVSNPNAPSIYAPRPLYNALQSRTDVPIYDYVSGTGINFNTPSRKLSFTSVDLDIWLRQFLATTDTMLSPEFLTPSSLVDIYTTVQHQSWMDRLRTAKSTLAESLSKLVIGVYDASVSSNAQDAFEQQALIALSNVYTVNAVVEFGAEVQANIPDTGATDTPQLYGTFIPGADSDSGVTVTAAKLALSNGGQPLVFLISTPGKNASGAVESDVKLDLTYSGTQIEHQISSLPNIEGYKASSWLSFVVPPTAETTNWPLNNVVKFQSPLPLRVFPTSPTMVSQSAVLPQLGPGAPLNDLTTWEYHIRYSEDFHYPQDQTSFQSTFNIQSQPLMAMLGGAPTDPFPDLAEYMTVYPEMQSDLSSKLSIITRTSSQQQFDAAATVLNAFVELVERVSDSLKGFLNPSGLSLAAMGAGFGTVGQQPYNFTIAENVDDQNRLVITLSPLPPAGISDPVVIITGYETEASKGEAEYTYLFYTEGDGEAKQYLPASIGQAITGRTVSLPGLQILSAQSALTSASIVRNSNLAEPFVYQTSEVAFPTPLRPTVDVTQEIDIATVGGSETVRPLKAQLNNLLNNLLLNAPSGTQTIQLTAAYRISINNNMPDVGQITLPILLMPATTFDPNAAAEASTSQDAMLTLFCSGIFSWFKFNTQKPIAGGDLLFGMTLMSPQQGDTLPPMPLLVLENLILHYKDWEDHP